MLCAVFAPAPATSLSTVHTFSGLADGGIPKAGLTLHGHALYGTAYGGVPDCSGQLNCNGTVFRFDPKRQRLTTLYALKAAADGFAPSAGVTFHGGQVYGTTSNQGFLSGTVFELDPRTGQLNTLYTFTGGDDGALPLASLTHCKGSLYGTNVASSSGLEFGTAFQYDLAQRKLKTLHGFSLADSSNGLSPLAGVAFRGSAFYGTISEGGAGPSAVGCSTLYRTDPVAHSFQTVHTFNGSDGCAPTARGRGVKAGAGSGL